MLRIRRIFNIHSVADFEPLMEGEGMIEAASTTFCHNITIVDDDLVEAAEQLEVNLLSVFNVAGVQLSPNTTTITIDDDDSKENCYALLIIVIPTMNVLYISLPPDSFLILQV